MSIHILQRALEISTINLIFFPPPTWINGKIFYKYIVRLLFTVNFLSVSFSTSSSWSLSVTATEIHQGCLVITAGIILTGENIKK